MSQYKINCLRRKKWLLLLPMLAALGYGVSMSDESMRANSRLNSAKPVEETLPEAIAKNAEGGVNLPITQVVLFNSGVGYFGRSGEVEGDARVDLVFPETDINDLLKSMTLQDFNNGRIAAVSYDSRAPISRTLASFAVNLNDNPTLANVLMQTRGEKVEVALQPAAAPAGQPSTLTGTILGMEKQKIASKGDEAIEIDLLNLLTSEGLRAVKLADVLRIKFSNPALEAELKRALDVLSLSHDSQKKAVQIQFSGEGKRKVRVSYVVETPIWKTSYRLVLDKVGKPFLQGWAHVENPSDEDWTNVKMALVSGRPISFKMDLYNPLYAPRPTVEPELYAGLRPPTYEGGFDANKAEIAGGGFGGFPGGPGVAASPTMASPQAPRAMARGGEDQRRKQAQAESLDALNDRSKLQNEEKAFAKGYAAELEANQNIALTNAATAGKLGDYFQYIIEFPVSLARQKSAMLPIINQEVEGERISIYNQNVQVKHPLLGFKFKNATEFHLAQGPITVYEGSNYAGDARVLDVQPKDERLLSYAIDLGTEVIPQDGPASSSVTSITANRGIMTTKRVLRLEKVYKITNRSATDRVLYIEHANRTNQGFKLIETPKPIEETAQLYRFRVDVPAGKAAEFKVLEEQPQGESVQLSNGDENLLRYFLKAKEVSPALKEQLKQALELRGKWTQTQRELQAVTAELGRITEDQDRIRKNLRETPREAPVYETYLKKLSEQEKEIDNATDKLKTLQQAEVNARKLFEQFLTTISE